MTEFATIQIERFRDPDGHPTCSKVWGRQACQFIGVHKFGTVEMCRLTGKDLHRGPHDMSRNQITELNCGWLRPSDGCPVWPSETN